MKLALKLLTILGGGLPSIEVSPSSWDFGSTPVGTAPTKEFTVTNVGNGTLVITLPITSDNAAFTITVDPPVTSVAPGASTTFTVQYSGALPQAYSGNISIVSNAASSPTVIAVTATSDYLANVALVSLDAFWPLNETSGTTIQELENNWDGNYTGATLAADTFPLLGYAVPNWDGINDVGNLHSASLSTAFNMARGLITVWIRNDVPTETAVTRFIVRFNRDASNELQVVKTTNANEYRIRYIAGGTIRDILLSITDTTAFHLLIEYADAANGSYFRVWKDNVQIANVTTGIGTTSGSGLLSTATTIGAAATSAALPFDGKIGAVGLKFNTATDATDRSRLSGGQ